MISGVATSEDVAAILGELRAVRAELAEVRDSLPPRFVSMAEAAKALAVDVQTIAAMLDRGDLQGRRAGRRRRVDVASLRKAPQT